MQDLTKTLNEGEITIFTIDFFTLMIIGFVLAVVLQFFQKYAILKSFFNAKFFLILTILSIVVWLFSLAMGGWDGISTSNTALSILVVAFSGLLSSFVLNLLITE